jgi:hypothetical protein
VGPRTGLDNKIKRKTFLPLPETDPRPSVPYNSLYTELSRLQINLCIEIITSDRRTRTTEDIRLSIDCLRLPRAAVRARQTRSFAYRVRVQHREITVNMHVQRLPTCSCST